MLNVVAVDIQEAYLSNPPPKKKKKEEE